MSASSGQRTRLSPPQRRVWQLQRESPALQSALRVRIDGALEPEALRRALEAVLGRVDVLGSVYERVPGVRYPFQVVRSEPALGWRVVDLASEVDLDAALDALARASWERSFDPERGPIVEATWAATGVARGVLLLSASAMAVDAGSASGLVRALAEELSAPGADAPREELVQYAAVAAWAHDLLASDDGAVGRDHFRALDVSPVFALRLPLETRTPAGFRPASTPVPLPPGATAAVAAATRGLGLDDGGTAVLLAAWLALLGRLAGTAAAGCAVRFDGRAHPDLAEAIGLFARTIPLAAATGEEVRFADLAAAVAAAVAETADWQDCFTADDDDRFATGVPAAFSFLRLPDPLESGGLRFEVERAEEVVERFRLALRAVATPSDLALEIAYDQSAFSPAIAAAHAERFGRFLAALASDPATRLGEPDLATASERARFAALNATATPAPEFGTLDAWLRAAAARASERIAVRSGAVELTYADLAARAERVASALAARCAGPESIVAIVSDRSVEMVVAIVGTLFAGAAYLPIDTAYPSERIAFLLADARAALVLAPASLRARLPVEAAERALWVDDPPVGAAGQSEVRSVPRPAPTLDPESLCYVLYTSGSTGRPKGVLVPHRGVVNYLAWATAEYRVTRDAAGAAVHSPIGFDLTVTSLFAPLVAGATVDLLPDEQGLEALAAGLASAPGYALAKLTPAHLGLLGPVAARSESLGDWARTLVVGGDQLLGESLAAWRERAPEVRIVNEYGPTETVVGSVAHALRAGDVGPGPVPIGRPIANTRLAVLDRDGRPVPEGVAGELSIAGAGVARGYLGRPELTAERFVPEAGGEMGARAYRTGDLVRLLPSGDLEYLGRNDDQVKVRGVRLELGEVEAALAGCPGVAAAAAALRADAAGDRRLIGYVVPDREPAPNVDELRRHLAARLPEVAVPSAFVMLASLPLTPHGKVDRAALPAPGGERPALERAYVAPRDPIETALAETWREVLGVDRVGVDDSFFALGGDSIRSVRAVALAKARGFDLTVDQLFRRTTIAALAADLAAERAAAAGADAGSDPVDRSAAQGADDAGAELLLAELEGLSEEEVEERLRRHLAAVERAG